MFNATATKYIVGGPIPTVDYNWYAPTTNSWPRKKIYGDEILNAFTVSTPKTGSAETLAEAQNIAREAANAYLNDYLKKETRIKCAFMAYECPIFEINGGKIIKVHFQNNVFTAEFLENDKAPSSLASYCVIA